MICRLIIKSVIWWYKVSHSVLNTTSLLPNISWQMPLMPVSTLASPPTLLDSLKIQVGLGNHTHPCGLGNSLDQACQSGLDNPTSLLCQGGQGQLHQLPLKMFPW